MWWKLKGGYVMPTTYLHIQEHHRKLKKLGPVWRTLMDSLNTEYVYWSRRWGNEEDQISSILNQKGDHTLSPKEAINDVILTIIFN